MSVSLNFIKTFAVCHPWVVCFLDWRLTKQRKENISNYAKTVSLWITERVHTNSLSINCKIQVKIDKLPEWKQFLQPLLNFLKLSVRIKVPRYLLENILKREVSEKRQTCKSSVLKHGTDPEKGSNVLSSYLTKIY